MVAEVGKGFNVMFGKECFKGYMIDSRVSKDNKTKCLLWFEDDDTAWELDEKKLMPVCGGRIGDRRLWEFIEKAFLYKNGKFKETYRTQEARMKTRTSGARNAKPCGVSTPISKVAENAKNAKNAKKLTCPECLRLCGSIPGLARHRSACKASSTLSVVVSEEEEALEALEAFEAFANDTTSTTSPTSTEASLNYAENADMVGAQGLFDFASSPVYQGNPPAGGVNNNVLSCHPCQDAFSRFLQLKKVYNAGFISQKDYSMKQAEILRGI